MIKRQGTKPKKRVKVLQLLVIANIWPMNIVAIVKGIILIKIIDLANDFSVCYDTIIWIILAMILCPRPVKNKEMHTI